MTKYRLAVLTYYPIQYQVPLFQKLATHPEIDLTVFFCKDLRSDHEFGIEWDIPLLEGYRYRFLRDLSPHPSTPRSLLWLLNPSIVTEVVRGDYDALWVHSYTYPSQWLAFMAGWITRTPLLQRTESTLLYRRPWWILLGKRLLLTPILKSMAACLTIGQLNAEFYKHYGVPDNRCFLVPYTVDNERFIAVAQKLKFHGSELRQSLDIAPDAAVILFVGRLVKRKRPLDLLKAYEKLRCRSQVYVVFVGEGPEREYLEQFSQEVRLGHKTRFVGFQNQTQLPRFYSIADVFVLPSEHDPWGLVINEAMCFSLPVITTTLVGACRDLVLNGENGYTYSAGDVSTLAECLDRIIANPELGSKMGRRSLEIISAWNYDTCIVGIIRALNTVCRTR